MRVALVAVLVLALAGPAEAQHAEVAYQSGATIYSIRADGSERRPIVRGSNPVWSPDGTRFAYVRAVGERSQLMTLDGPLTPLRKGVQDGAPAWSPDGSALAFARFVTTGERLRSEIVVLAGGVERVRLRVKVDLRLTSVSGPAWSPDGGTIAYTRSRLDRRGDFDPAIWAIPAAGGAPRRLVPDAQSPAYAPDGRLAFASVRDRNGKVCGSHECWFAGEIYTAAADGTGARRLTHNVGDDGGPVWSPDGSRLLFTSDRTLPEHDSAEVYSVAADGSCLTWLTNGTPASGAGTWRPHSGTRFDPGSCDPAARPPLIETPALPTRPGGLWLGATYGELLLSSTARGSYMRYADCVTFAPCREPVSVGLERACRTLSFRGLESFRYYRRRGALIAYHAPDTVIRVLSGPAVTQLFLGGAETIGDVLSVVDALRPLGSPGRVARLAPPRIPRALARRLERTARAYRRIGARPETARALGIERFELDARLRFRRAVRAFGPYRYARC